MCFIDTAAQRHPHICLLSHLKPIFTKMNTGGQEKPEREISLSQSVQDEIIEEDKEFSPVPYRRHATVKRAPILSGYHSRKLIRDDVPEADGHLNSARTSRNKFESIFLVELSTLFLLKSLFFLKVFS